MKRKYRFLPSLLGGLLAFTVTASGNRHEAGRGTKSTEATSGRP